MTGSMSPQDQEMAKYLARSVTDEMQIWIKFSFYTEVVLGENSDRHRSDFIREGWQYRASVLEPTIGLSSFNSIKQKILKWIDFSRSIRNESQAFRDVSNAINSALDDAETKDIGAWVNEGAFLDVWRDQWRGQADPPGAMGVEVVGGALNDPQLAHREDSPTHLEGLLPYEGFTDLVENVPIDDLVDKRFWIVLISDSIGMKTSREIEVMLWLGAEAILGGLTDLRRASWIRQAAKYGYVAREVEVQLWKGEMDEFASKFHLDMYSSQLPDRDGYLKSLEFALISSGLPITHNEDLVDDLDSYFPGWIPRLRELIGGMIAWDIKVFFGDKNDPEGEGYGQRKYLEAFFYGYWIHILSEIQPFGWIDGIRNNTRFEDVPWPSSEAQLVADDS